MKISYLILAHNNFSHLNRLIGALSDGNADFYIHIDKKAAIEYGNSNASVHIIPQRFDIKWSGFTMIEATLALMQTAYDKSPESDYYILISGADYPVRPVNFLYDQLKAGKEFINIGEAPSPHQPMSRFEYYYFEYDRRNHRFHPYSLVEKICKKLGVKRRFNCNFKIYVGSQWFALTRSCIGYILDAVKDKAYEQFFRHALVPDEAFFQTIVGNSPFMSNIAPAMTYTDWNVPVPPAEINDKHIEILKSQSVFDYEFGPCKAYFARKFTDNSKDTVDRIENELRQ